MLELVSNSPTQETEGDEEHEEENDDGIAKPPNPNLPANIRSG
jgi:hypothetical protein